MALMARGSKRLPARSRTRLCSRVSRLGSREPADYDVGVEQEAGKHVLTSPKRFPKFGVIVVYDVADNLHPSHPGPFQRLASLSFGRLKHGNGPAAFRDGNDVSPLIDFVE
jgi:hypothetical protein